MFLQPKKIKYKKVKKGKLKNFNFKTNLLKFGTIGLKSIDSGIINARQIESARKIIKRKLKKNGKLWIRIFPHLPITNKPNESRMGKGKGNVSYWVARIKKGTILFEICGVQIKIAKDALKSGGFKLPIKTIVID